MVAALDVGSAANTGWWRSSGPGISSEGRDVDSLCDALAADLAEGAKVALGFESPLWIPFAAESSRFGKARPVEPKAWSYGAGATVLPHSVQQATYVLHRLAAPPVPPLPTLAPERLRGGTAQLLVWEAMVTGEAKDRSAAEAHISDARAAAEEFRRRWDAGDDRSDLGDAPSISLPGLAVVVSGLAQDLELLTAVPMVVRAPDLPA